MYTSLLQNIVGACPRDRADQGHNTNFHKVRSHIGVDGNEKAGKGANRAASHPNMADVTEGATVLPMKTKCGPNMSWLMMTQILSSPTPARYHSIELKRGHEAKNYPPTLWRPLSHLIIAF